MRPLLHPSIDDVTLEGILHALADPVRVAIYTELAASESPQTCSNLQQVLGERPVPKSTLSQHFRILRESGLIRSERAGVEMRSQTRCKEIERRFPGLLPSILKAYAAEAGERARRAKHKTTSRKGRST
jgi:DNA-binding transcriptional ArsR family regulator